MLFVAGLSASSTVRGLPLTVTPRVSLSVMLMFALVKLSDPDAPVTLILSIGSSMWSSTGFRLKLPSPLISPAAMLMSKFATAA